MPDKPVLTRDAILSGEINRLTEGARKNIPVMSDQQRHELVQQTIESLDDTGELWVFGYGSLIWNPAIEFADQRRCRIQGYQREFCFWTTFSRGSPELPGLMMGLVEGDYCDGLAYRIDLKVAATELDILFKRELFTFVYQPIWIDALCSETAKTFRVLTFVVDIKNERFVQSLSETDVVTTIAIAQGPLGRNCDYLFDLNQKLRELRFSDAKLTDLEKRVVEYQQTLK